MNTGAALPHGNRFCGGNRGPERATITYIGTWVHDTIQCLWRVAVPGRGTVAGQLTIAPLWRSGFLT